MAKNCLGNYFLILLLIVMFGLLYIYVDNYRPYREKFYQAACVAQAAQIAQAEAAALSKKYIIPQENLAIIQGVNLPDQPISPVTQFDNDPSSASIDGKSGSPSQMFMLAFNKVSPDCCPSVYSTSQGCVCMTDDQINWISQRGNNNRFNKCDGTSEY
jgi:hypothetical protein